VGLTALWPACAPGFGSLPPLLRDDDQRGASCHATARITKSSFPSVYFSLLLLGRSPVRRRAHGSVGLGGGGPSPDATRASVSVWCGVRIGVQGGGNGGVRRDVKHPWARRVKTLCLTGPACVTDARHEDLWRRRSTHSYGHGCCPLLFAAILLSSLVFGTGVDVDDGYRHRVGVWGMDG
jgi:hypothetical protein